MLNVHRIYWQPLLVMVDARSYFDDSGTHDGSVATIIGGYVATKESWEEIEKPWRAILNEFSYKGVHCFHATDCLAQTNQFERLSKPECKYVYRQLSDILEQANLRPVYTAVWMADWQAITDTNFKQFFSSAYDFCVDRVIHEVVNWSANHAGGTRVPIMLAMQKDHASESQATFDSWRRVKVVGDKIGALAHEYPDGFIPLQAADMLAHEVYRHCIWWHRAENKLSPVPKRTHCRVLTKIMRGQRASGGFYDRSDLEGFATGITRQEF